MKTIIAIAIGLLLAGAAAVADAEIGDPPSWIWDDRFYEYRIELHALEEWYGYSKQFHGSGGDLYVEADDAGWSALLSIVASRLLGEQVEVNLVTLEEIEAVCGSGFVGCHLPDRPTFIYAERRLLDGVWRFDIPTLIHEFAHLIRRRAGAAGSLHGPAYQTWLARLYSELMLVDLRPYCTWHGVDCDWTREQQARS